MKLLLDGMLAPSIADHLRRHRHDVAAVSELPELRGLADADLLDRCQAEGQAIATYNRDDFLELDREYRRVGREHCGIVILNPRRFPQGAQSVEPLATGLAKLLEAGAPYPGFVHWLR